MHRAIEKLSEDYRAAVYLIFFEELSYEQAAKVLGKSKKQIDNLIYRAAIKGINTELNTDIEKAFSDDYTYEAFLAEAIIQNLISGLYVDITDVKNNFKHEHFKNIVVEYCDKHGIK